MTRDRVQAQQAQRPPKGVRFVRGVVSAISPLTVQIAGGGSVGGLALPGAIYTVGQAVLVSWQEPGIGPVFPLQTTPTPVPPTTGTITFAGTAGHWDTGGHMTTVTRQGALGLLNLQMSVGATPPAYSAAIATISDTPAGFRPARVVNLDAVLFNGSWGSQRCTLDVEPDGRVMVMSSTVPIAANAGIFASIPLPLT